LGYAVFLHYILHWGALRFYALLKGALTEKKFEKGCFRPQWKHYGNMAIARIFCQ